MGRAEQILEIIGRAPERTWTSGEVSVHLECAPALVNGVMREMVRRSQLVRVEPGQYCLPSRFERSASTPVDTSPEPATPGERELLLSTLRKIGHPVPGSSLAQRLGRSGLHRTRVAEVAADLCREQALTRREDGKYALPHWRVL